MNIHSLLSVSCALCLAFGMPTIGIGQEVNDGDQVKGAFYGRLIDDDANPVTDAEVSLQGSGYFRTQTDEQGNFNFLDKIEAGEYRLRIKSELWVGITDFRKMPQVTVDPDHPSEKNFTLKRACQIELTVVDETGGPVRGAVYYRPVGGDRFRNADRLVTNAAGTVKIGGLAASEGPYMVGVSSASHAFGHAVVEVSEPGKVVKQSIVLQAGKPVAGTALCTDGEPPAGWSFYALPTWWNFGSYPTGTKIGEDGSFELPHIANENYNLLIFIPTGAGMSMSRSVLSDVNLSAMEQPLRVSVNYPSPKSMNYLTGTIRWVGKPLKDGISISGYSEELKHHTDYHLEAGTTDFRIGPVPKGTYRIRADHPQVEIMNLRKIKDLNDLDHVKIPNEEPLQVVLRVRRPAGVQGVVVDAETKEPVTNFRVRMTKLQTLSGPNYVQDDNWKLAKDEAGKFQSQVVGPGIYKVSISADGYAIQTSEPVNTDEQPDEVLEFELRPGVSLFGEVVDANGQPVNGATVRALSLTSGSMPRVLDRFMTMEGAVETKDGRFELKNLQLGGESIRVDHPQFAFKVVPAIEVGKQNEPLRIELSKGATIRGIVFDSNGKPQANETLFFQDDYAYGGNDREAGAFGTTTTDSDGHYEMGFLPETTVYVSRAEEWSANGVVRHAVQTGPSGVHELNLGGTEQLTGRFFVNDEPLKDFRLQLAGNDSVFGAMKMFASTDDQGRFFFFGPPPGYWTLYRALDKQAGEWVEVRKVEVPAEGGLDLGEIRCKSGTITVQCKAKDLALLETLQMDLRQYSPRHFFGRSVANRQPRDVPTDPFVFLDVTPGDFELACRTASGVSIVQRLTVTESELNSIIPFDVPSGKESVTLEIRDEGGEPLDSTFMLVSQDERLLIYLYPNPGESPPGTYKVDDLPAGRYNLMLGNARNGAGVAVVDIKRGQENKMVLSVPRKQHAAKGIARLATTDENGVFVPCRVTVDGNAGSPIEQYQGKFQMDLSGEPGTYDLKITHPGFVPLVRTIELTPVGRSTPMPSTSDIHIQLIRQK